MTVSPEPAPRVLRDHVGVLRRQWAVVALVTGVAMAVALVASLTQTPTYRATAEVLFPQEPVALADVQTDQIVEERRLDADRVIAGEVAFAGSEQVADRVEAELGTGGAVVVDDVRDSDVLTFTGSADTADRAAALANAWADAYLAARTEQATLRGDAVTAVLDEQLAALDAELAALAAQDASDPATAARIEALTGQRARVQSARDEAAADTRLAESAAPTLIEAARPPARPAEPATARNLALALLFGLAVGLVLAYARDHLADRIRDADEVERRSGLPVLGTLADLPGEGVRTLALDDPALAGLDGPVAGLLGANPAPDGASVLVVPLGTRGADVRHGVGLLAGLGHPPVGVVLTEA